MKKRVLTLLLAALMAFAALSGDKHPF